MTLLFPPAPRPFFPVPALPGVPPRVTGPVFSQVRETPHPLAQKLLRTAQFPVVLPKSGKPMTPSALLRDSASRLSDSLSDVTALYLQEVTTDGHDGPTTSLLVRFQTVMPYSLHASRARYDRVRRGLLGRLLSNLAQAAAPFVRVFTPTEFVDKEQFDARWEYEFDDAVHEAVAHAYPNRTPAAHEAIVAGLSRRERAKIAARNGMTTYLDAHHAGATLGLRTLFTPEDEVHAAVLALPDDLRHGTQRAVRLTEKLHALHPNVHDQEANRGGDLHDEFDWGYLVYPAFLVIANREMKVDPVCEYLEEQWQMAAEHGDTWPQLALKLDTAAEHVRAAKLLTRTCRALKLVQDALVSLGAEVC